MAKSGTKRRPPADAARNGGPAARSDLLAGHGLAIEHRPVEALIPYARNARTHSEDQVALIAGSIREFGFTNPVLVDGASGVIAGHGRLMAARQLGLTSVPVIELGHLTEAQKRAPIRLRVRASRFHSALAVGERCEGQVVLVPRILPGLRPGGHVDGEPAARRGRHGCCRHGLAR